MPTLGFTDSGLDDRPGAPPLGHWCWEALGVGFGVVGFGVVGFGVGTFFGWVGIW